MAKAIDSGDGPLRTIDRVVPIDWVDYNGHMNESRYGQAFSDAADHVLAAIGAGAAYIRGGNSFFTVEAQTRFLNEVHAGQHIWVDTIVRQAAGKKLILHHVLYGDGVAGPLARCEQTLIHVSLTTRRSCEPETHVSQGMLQPGQAACQHQHRPGQIAINHRRTRSTQLSNIAETKMSSETLPWTPDFERYAIVHQIEAATIDEDVCSGALERRQRESASRALATRKQSRPANRPSAVARDAARSARYPCRH